MSVLGNKILARRKELKLLQRDLTGGEITVGYISQIETGKAVPSIDTLEDIAKRLKVPFTYLLDDHAELTSVALNTTTVGNAIELQQTIINSLSEKKYSEVINLCYTLKTTYSDMSLGHLGFLCDYYKAIAFYKMSDYNNSILIFEPCLDDLLGYRYFEYYCMGCFYVGISYHRLSKFADCEKYSNMALAAIEKYDLDLNDIRSRIMINLAACAGESNNFYQAYEIYMNIINLSLKGQFSPTYIADAYSGVAACNLEIGNLHESRVFADKAAYLYELINDTIPLTLLKNTFGQVFYRQKQYEEAISYFRNAANVLLEYGMPGESAINRAWLSKTHSELGNLHDALSSGKQALADAKNSQSGLTVANARHALGLAYYKLQRPIRAIALLRRAERDMADTGSKNVLPELCQLLANIYLEHGKLDQAKAMMNKAMNLLLNKDLTVKKPKTDAK